MFDKIPGRIIVIALFLSIIFAACKSHSDPIEKILSEMTLEEKVGQMVQITLDVVTKGENIKSSYEPVELDEVVLRKAIVDYKIGSILNTANEKALALNRWHVIIQKIDSVSRHETRLGIPVIYGIDAIHGATYTAEATMFPQQIGMAATWNPELAEKAASIAAYDARSSGIPWNFSPVADIGMDPRWARHWETFGEDPLLASVMTVAYVNGYEGRENIVNNDFRMASCLKHFIGYGSPVSGKDRTPALIPEIELRERHLPSFKAGIQAGAHSVMLNSGIINGVPVHASRAIITDLLKTELGFKGVVLTDWADVEKLVKRDLVAEDIRAAIKFSVNAGIDMVMVPYLYEEFFSELLSLVKEGEIPMARIDDAVRRILWLKSQTGLLERPVLDENFGAMTSSKEHEKIAYHSAIESITLLKNENDLLPLKPGNRILVAGPNANSMRTLNGGWSYSWQGEKTDEFTGNQNTIFKALLSRFGESKVSLVEGVSYRHEGAFFEDYDSGIELAVTKAMLADVVVLCLGENSYCEKPGDIHDLRISPLQEKLALRILSLGKPVVLVLNQGRPRLITGIAEKSNAILHTYLPGNQGGNALADILKGDGNPSGKLPYTYPKYANSLLNYYHKPSAANIGLMEAYSNKASEDILYPFGFGLSYTDFKYENLHLSKELMGKADTVKVSVHVTNTGKRAGKEVVQLYTIDHFASITPDVKRLRAFEKIEILPGETKKVTFLISARDFSFINSDNRRVSEAGKFTIQVDKLNKHLTLSEDVFIN
jgi:beta-glucosidase